jgi:drug/metabolite transporter (DMT)-like permease
MKWALLGIIVLCNTFGDVFNTAGMKRHGEVEDFSPRNFLPLLWGILTNPLVIAGLAAMALSFFALLALLSIANVSFAIPATAASYLLEIALAKYVLKEEIGWKRWIGASLVAFGVLLISL